MDQNVINAVAPKSGEQDDQQQQGLIPIDFDAIGYVPGKYAAWRCSPEDCYGPDELGEYQAAIEQLIQNVNKCDAAARIWEVLQAWEARLFRRNYHFLSAGQKGWGMFGGSSASAMVGQSIMATQNGMKLFSCNVYGARHKKIVSLLSREVPGVQAVAEDDSDPLDQAAAEEAEKYIKIFEHQASLKERLAEAASYFYTDDRVMALTYTVADQTRWGTEMQDAERAVYGMPESDGVTPETELDGGAGGDAPTRREDTLILGKLESKVPLLCDHEHQMGWMRGQWETSVNTLRARYPWVRNKIGTQGDVGGMDQIDRMARINVRLAVQASSTSGEAYKNDATETVTYFRPSEYEAIADDNVRQVFFDTFPDGLEVWHAGGQLALVRNCRVSDHVKIEHPAPGDGQNRESIGTNYLPLQKILNANISLLDRYFRSAIGRRFAGEPYIDTEALNRQTADPAKFTPVDMKSLRPTDKLSDVIAVENVPQPNTAMFEFIQWLIQGAPEAMDGASPTVFGANDGEEGTFGEARLNRDQALAVFSMPWSALCRLVVSVTEQAVRSAAVNRKANISASLPGQQKMEIELSKLQGSVLCHPESLEIPQSLAEQEMQMMQLLEQSANVAVYQQILQDPQNLQVLSQMPTLRALGLKIPVAEAAEQQQGEFEILMRSGPTPNPQLAQVQQQIQMAENDPEAQTPQGQMMLQQLQQAAQQIPPMVSTVPVAQDTSENHAVHAAVVDGMLTSATGRKLKYGNQEQKAIYQNLYLHWQEHMAVLKQLTPPPQVEMKANVSIDPTKLPPEAQAKAFQALGLQVSPDEVTPQEQTHEVTTEKEGVDAAGVPVKQKVSVVGKPLG